MSETPADRYRRIAAGFGAAVAGTGDWGAPTPVPAWTARDVVAHLIGWFPPFLRDGSGIVLPPGPSVADDPAGAWEHHTTALQAVLDDPATAEQVFAHVHLPEMPVPDAVDRFYTTDVLMHTWDLARAGGLDDGLDPDECEAVLAGMLPMDEVLRNSGHYGPKQPVDDDASPVLRLMAFVGRDPSWQPALRH
ncbi:MAG: TIGR03086 family metal-binding protein [Dermatophilaceae bacterium]